MRFVTRMFQSVKIHEKLQFWKSIKFQIRKIHILPTLYFWCSHAYHSIPISFRKFDCFRQNNLAVQ